MSAPKQATVIGRGLGGELRELRKDRKLTCQRVAEQLGRRVSKISRMETGKQGITPEESRHAGRLRVIGDERRRLLAMAQRSADLVGGRCRVLEMAAEPNICPGCAAGSSPPHRRCIGRRCCLARYGPLASSADE
ncbi:helix-turn-helix domain-containing protein [Saccharopolyspora erythraea]|uniref:helix-turn-helix domain-containing protein n=1 Tax=Saccharopolyspora erythraea TaxID=1836 RepID=UPI001BA7F9C7|nr:helix-turn-helix transcriptional regulator [Saccharopolyspora erythraea]QUH01313.1 helix-turn-helix domain-containing protein [Saccharopolyspora erythraea]